MGMGQITVYYYNYNIIFKILDSELLFVNFIQSCKRERT